jgi:hypothetical protein
MNFKDFKDFNEAKNNLQSIVGNMTGTSGTLTIDGSTISYSVEGTLVGFKWKYVGIAKDSKTGKMGKAITNSPTGAIEHCLEDLFKKF